MLRLPESETVDLLEKKVLFVMMQAIVLHVKGTHGNVYKFIAHAAEGRFENRNVPHFPRGSDEWVIPAAKREMIRKAYMKI